MGREGAGSVQRASHFARVTLVSLAVAPACGARTGLLFEAEEDAAQPGSDGRAGAPNAAGIGGVGARAAAGGTSSGAGLGGAGMAGSAGMAGMPEPSCELSAKVELEAFGPTENSYYFGIAHSGERTYTVGAKYGVLTGAEGEMHHTELFSIDGAGNAERTLFAIADNDGATDVVATESNELYIAGNTAGPFINSDWGDQGCFVARVGADGQLAWVSQFGSAMYEFVAGLGVGPGGEVYVVGESTGGFVHRYDTDGRWLWSRQFGTTAGGVATDTAGNAYVTGTLDVEGDPNALLQKLSPDGTLLWERTFGTTGRDDGLAVVVGSEGRVYVGGTTSGRLSGAEFDGEEDRFEGGTAAFLQRFDADGNVIWTRQFWLDAENSVDALALDRSGNVFLVGVATHYMGSGSFLRAYDAAGRLGLSQTFTGSANDVALAPDCTAYVAGRFILEGPPLVDAFVVRVRPTLR